jgi:GTP-binding nuclear protein Ran
MTQILIIQEAMWMNFTGVEEHAKAIKIGVGKVNALSGEPWKEGLDGEIQPYVVVPDQKWLDGVNAEDGCIKQFVAMPLGKGYTVEAQITGEETFGGIQIAVYDGKAERKQRHTPQDAFTLPAPNFLAPPLPLGAVAPSDNIPTFKMILVGGPSVGKTSFVKRHVTGEFEKTYVPTVGVQVMPVLFHTNIGPVRYMIWDCSGQEINEAHYVGAKCAIIMFDVSSERSYQQVPKWYKSITNVCEKIPIVLCGNKIDVDKTHVMKKRNRFAKKKNLVYYDISAKSNYNFEHPFIHISRVLSEHKDLQFVCAPALAPPEVVIDANLLAQYEQDLLQAVTVALPDEDDDFDVGPTQAPSQAREMGLAAAGKIKQKIKQDYRGKDFWDITSEQKLFVHIVNSAMYQEITGRPPPETPVDARSYTENGYPWFDIYEEEAAIPRSNALANVKTVKEMDMQAFGVPQQDDSTVNIAANQVMVINHNPSGNVRTGDW